MNVVTDVFYSNAFDEERVKMVRVQHTDTGEERLMQPHELTDPEDVEVGDEEAYRVNLSSSRVFEQYETQQNYNFDPDY